MAEKRKSVSKHPYWCRRNRTSTSDLLFPYLLGPELFVSPPMSTVQTRPVYLTARSGSSLSCVFPFIPGYSSFANPMVSFDSNLVPSNYYMLNMVLLKIFQLDWQHSLSFHHEWIGVGLQGPVLLTWLMFSLIPWFLLVAILILVFKGSFKTSGCQIIH